MATTASVQSESGRIIYNYAGSDFQHPICFHSSEEGPDHIVQKRPGYRSSAEGPDHNYCAKAARIRSGWPGHVFGRTHLVQKQAGVQGIIGPGSGRTQSARYQFPCFETRLPSSFRQPRIIIYCAVPAPDPIWCFAISAPDPVWCCAIPAPDPIWCCAIPAPDPVWCCAVPAPDPIWLWLTVSGFGSKPVCKSHRARFQPTLPSRSGPDANRIRHVYWGDREWSGGGSVLTID